MRFEIPDRLPQLLGLTETERQTVQGKQHLAYRRIIGGTVDGQHQVGERRSFPADYRPGWILRRSTGYAEHQPPFRLRNERGLPSSGRSHKNSCATAVAVFVKMTLVTNKIFQQVSPNTNLEVLVRIDACINKQSGNGNKLPVIDVVGIAQARLGREEHIYRQSQSGT